MALKTPLYENHLAHGGKVVEFAGYLLPVQYEAGVITEHNAVRNGVGIFDVSHMGEFELSGEGAFASIQNLVTNDISKMCDNQIIYALLLNNNGGEVDDLLVYKHNDLRYTLVVNASNIEKDFNWVITHLSPNTKCENKSDATGQVAVQGPLAEKLMLKFISGKDLPEKRHTFKENVLMCGVKCLISRTGYTGEDGFEIYSDSNKISVIYEEILDKGKEFGILPCGLGCRDTLRFETALTLYGHELREDFLASEVGVNWCIKMDKQFIGKSALLENAPKFKRKGIKLIDKGIAREGSKIFADGKEIGFITTGTFSPTLECAIAMVRIEKNFGGSEVYAEVRGRLLKAEIVPLPFYKSADLKKVEDKFKNN